MAARDGTFHRTAEKDPNSLPSGIEKNKELLQKISRVDYQILILDKHYIEDLSSKELILYPTKNFENEDFVRRSVLPCVRQRLLNPSDRGANHTLHSGILEVRSYERLALAVVHYGGDEKLVVDHTEYLVKLFNKDFQNGLDERFRKEKLKNFKEELDKFLSRHIGSIK